MIQDRVGSSSPSLRTLAVIALLGVFGALLVLLKPVLTPVFVAFLLAYMLDPLVDRFEAVGLPRVVGIVVLLLLAGLALVAFGLLLVPVLVRDLSSLFAELPAAARHLLGRIEPLLGDLGVELPGSAAEILHRFEGQLGKIGPAAIGSLETALRVAVGGTASLMSGLAAAVMVPIFAFYLLSDFDIIVDEVRALLPARWRPTVVTIAREVDHVLGQFIRGQLSVMVILAVLYAVGYSLVGVRLAIPIGIVAGGLAFIPYVGGAVALGLALLMVGLHYVDMTQVLAVVGVYAVIQVLEGFIITPRIVGDKLGLGPVWVLFALMAFAELFGFMGVMLALPAAAVIKVLVTHGLREYRESDLFLRSQQTEPPPPPPPPELPEPPAAEPAIAAAPRARLARHRTPPRRRRPLGR